MWKGMFQDEFFSIVSKCKNSQVKNLVLRGDAQVTRCSHDARQFQILGPVERSRRIMILGRQQLLAVFFAPPARENVFRVGVDPMVV